MLSFTRAQIANPRCFDARTDFENAGLSDFTAVNSEWRRKFEERLRRSDARGGGISKNLDWSDDILELHEISTLVIQEGNLESLYNRILDAAINLMSSDMASMHLLDLERSQLRLFASKGFHPQSAIFWESVSVESGPHVFLASNMAQAITVILHELATNAAKFGSLSSLKGKVEVTWLQTADENSSYAGLRVAARQPRSLREKASAHP
jgi:hypothetical protein